MAHLLVLTLSLALSAGEELPPPPPPPLLPAPAAQPAFEPAAAPQPGPSAEIEASLDEGFNGARVTATGAVAAFTGALLVGGSTYLAMNVRSLGTGGILLFMASIPLSLFAGTGLAVLAHRALGGQGSYGAHLAGGAIGGGVALVVSMFAATQVKNVGSLGTGGIAGWISAAAVLFGAGTGLWAELSHFRTLREMQAAASLVPVPGGAVAMVGFGF